MNTLFSTVNDRAAPDSMEELSHCLKQHMPRNWEACTCVMRYVIQFYSNLDHNELRDLVMILDLIALSYCEREGRDTDYWNERWGYETQKKRKELFNGLLMNVFTPEVQKIFKVFKKQQLSEKDKHLNPNEILAALLDFLLQVLHCEQNISSGERQLYDLLSNQLSFLLALLGDLPFQPTHLGFEEQVNNILEEFEMLANEAGSYIHACVFSVHPVAEDWSHAAAINLLEKAELLNVKIKHHCNKFSELPMSVILRSAVVDSFFIVDSLIGDIENLENHINFTDDDGSKIQIGRLKDLLNASKSIIEVADRIPQGDEYIYANEHKEALIQIRDLAYQAEYLINAHALETIPTWYINLRLPSIVEEIKIVIDQRLQVQKMQASNVTKASDHGETSSITRSNLVTLDGSDVLTFNDTREEKIKEDLFRRSIRSRKIISISGMPGLGKTTTASKLYNCSEIFEHFDRRAWCLVSQTYNLRSLFVQILRDIAPNQDTDPGMETAELGVSIHKSLFGRRFLIVLDDVWVSDVLDKLIRYLPDEHNGSRVIVTSRVKDVTPEDSIFHTLPLLSNDQCWDLLKKKVFPNPKQCCPSQLDEIGKQIAEKCCGIPLAVVGTAGILANLEKERSEWERVGKQLDMLLLDDQNDYRKILELSYQHLPHNLKPCFLYFAAFPADADISKNELTWFWIAQGFVQKQENKSPEEIAEMYFLDLINRSLVMPARKGSDGRIKICRIHDLLHDICVAKANEENFLKSTNDFSMFEKHQHRSASDIFQKPFGLHCRSFRDVHTNQTSYLRTMPLLKIVELPPKEYGSHNMYPRFDLPVQLRYLGIGELQKRMVANLFNLEYINVCSKETVVVPSVILRMVKLRHMLVRKVAEFDEDCSAVTVTNNLTTLSRVRINHRKDEDILRYSPHLRKLKCEIGGDVVLFPDFGDLDALESLRLNFWDRWHNKLSLSKASFPPSLKRLCLSNCELPWKNMSIIGELPKLEVLKLEYNAFVGKEWETKDDEFQQLRFLMIVCESLEQWITEISHFPRLEQLVLSKCDKLEEIPSDLGYIQSMRRIHVASQEEKLKSSAMEIEQEQRENGNTRLQVHTSNYLFKEHEN